MTPDLPRPLLWTEIETLDEFLVGNPFNKAIYNVFECLQDKKEYKHLSPGLNPVKVFNELYYQLTRFYYRNDKNLNNPKLAAEIKKDLGWEYAADLISIMMNYYIVVRKQGGNWFGSLLPRKHYEIKGINNPFEDAFLMLNIPNVNWKDIKIDPMRPNPVPLKELQDMNLNWEKITHRYNWGVIKDILGLWDYYEDKKIVARMIVWNMYVNHCYNKDTFEHLIDLLGEDDETIISYKSMVDIKPTTIGIEDEDKRFIDSYNYNNNSESDNKIQDKEDEEIVELKRELEYYKLKVSDLEKRNKALEEQHKEDEARLSAGFDSLVLETIEDGKVVDQQLLNSDTNKALSESQKQNELSRKQIQEMEKQIQALNDKLGKETVPLKSLADGLKTYAKLYGLKEGKDLLKSLSYLLKKEHVWIDNIDSLENFFITAENENKQPVYQGDYVLTKNVENEVNGVASGATGINVNKKGE